MSEIEFICPYCETKQFIEIESMNENDVWIELCRKCNREFEYRIEYSVDGYADKIADKIEVKND